MRTISFIEETNGDNLFRIERGGRTVGIKRTGEYEGVEDFTRGGNDVVFRTADLQDALTNVLALTKRKAQESDLSDSVERDTAVEVGRAVAIGKSNCVLSRDTDGDIRYTHACGDEHFFARREIRSLLDLIAS